MKKTLLKRISVLVMAVMILSTLYAGTAFAAETSPLAVKAPIEARMDPNRRSDLADDPDFRNPTKDKIDQIIDIAIDIGSNFVPCGGTIVNYIKSKSPKKEKTTRTETAINMTGDVITELFPMAEPVVIIVTDVATKLVNLFWK